MKILIMAFTFYFSSEAFASECVVGDKPLPSKDCVHCNETPKAPTESLPKAMGAFSNLLNDKDDQLALVNKLKAYSQVLNTPKAKSECSNFKKLMSDYQAIFQKELGECEKGPTTFFDRRKVVCNYVLNDYAQKILETFYAHWSKPGPDGKPVVIAGKTMEQIEGPIRAHDSWCKKVKKSYGTKLFLSCGEVENWVGQFNITKKVHESMVKDMASSDSAKDSTVDRQKLFEEGCKYFDKNPATTFTSGLYMKCITSSF